MNAQPFDDVCCASLPTDALGVLAEVRDLPGITVALVETRAWVRWPAGDESVLRRLLPVPGVELYVQDEGYWRRHGRHLPAFDFPQGLPYRPLAAVLTPAPVRTEGTLETCPTKTVGHVSNVPKPDLKPVLLTLVLDQSPRSATALRARPSDLASWADTMPAGRLATLLAACRGAEILVLGARLPMLPAGERYWGDDVLLPLGYRAEPDLPASALRAGLGIAADELVLLRFDGAEAIARSAFRPLSRAQLRLMLRATPS